MSGVKELTTHMERPTKADRELIERAYRYAESAHEGQLRYSGEPHFTHCFEVARTLAWLGMGPRTIAAGLLHDTLEDTEVTPADIEDAFGPEILFLVQGVTKLRKLQYRGQSRHVESLRKLFVATSQDVRVLLIKLADRHHNMSTLQHVPDQEKRERIALETLQIHAPLAYRLGVRKLHRDLEDLAFEYAYPEEFHKVERVIHERYQHLKRHLDKIERSIKKGLAKEGYRNVTTECRIKGYYSLYKKLQRKNWDLQKIFDIGAVRIVVPTISDCYYLLGVIHSKWWRPLPGRVKDYIAVPKPNGYQSLHTTVFTGDGNIIEIQIRTWQMHVEAEYGIASHAGYKQGISKNDNPNMLWLQQFLPTFRRSANAGKPSDVEPQPHTPHWLRELVEMQESVSEPHELIKNLQLDFFEHRIFVFTPQGDVIDLPLHSTPIDFAFAIHSDIGHHTAGAKVNGKLVPLDTTLRNGDIVDIQTKKNSQPSAKWLDFARTTLARRKIRSAVSQQGGQPSGT
jgi:GTP pyrophosphokinase